MKLNLGQIKTLIILILLAIIAGQGMWVYNMYGAYRAQLSLALNASIETAVLREGSGRYEQVGGTIVQSKSPRAYGQDTTRYITKTIHTEDTTFQATFDRFDPNSDFKMFQFLIKDELPVNLSNLDSILRLELAARKFLLSQTYVEYLDLNTNEVINTSYTSASKSQGFIASGIVVMDIFKSIGIKAYAQSPTYAILRLMAFQLGLSVILITICTGFLFMIIRTFFWKEKEEIMRQDSVNAMTHEFKRPISSALAQASLIPYYLNKEEDGKVQQYATNIMLELNKLTSYTERVQKLSNNSKEHIHLTKIDIDIRDFFQSIAKKYTNTHDTDNKTVTIRLDITASRTHIAADLLHFSNMIENLIENAIKYSSSNLMIDISIRDRTDSWKISIKDNGFGIPPKEIAQVFDRFYRGAAKEVQRSAGFGLGLTYVKALAEAHGGTIEVESKFGEGSEFVLYLP